MEMEVEMKSGGKGAAATGNPPRPLSQGSSD